MIRLPFKIDWLTALGMAGVLLAIGSCGYNAFLGTRPEVVPAATPPVVQDSLPEQTTSQRPGYTPYIAPRHQEGTEGVSVVPPPRISPLETNIAGAWAAAQIDYETSQKMLVQEVQWMKQQLRENQDDHGDGVTEADLERILKSGLLPQ